MSQTSLFCNTVEAFASIFTSNLFTLLAIFLSLQSSVLNYFGNTDLSLFADDVEGCGEAPRGGDLGVRGA